MRQLLQLLTNQVQPAVNCLWAVYYLCTVWQLSESDSNLCLCFRTSVSAVSQQLQSESVSIYSDQVTEQSSRYKLSVKKM